MPRSKYNNIRTIAPDDKELFVIRKDYSGGQNNRIFGTNIGDNQATVLINVDISVPGQRIKRRGTDLIEDLGNNPGTEIFGFEPDGGTNLLVATEGSNLKTWPATGSFTTRKSDFTSGLQTSIIKIGESGLGDVFVVGNGTDNWFRFDPANLSSPQDLGNTNTSPPLSTVSIYYRNRWWILKSNNLYWADAFDDDYSGAFDRTTNFYRIPVGTERALIGIRDLGIIVIGHDQIWGINPSITPAATDLPEKITEIGCVANKTAVQVADDVYYLASDGVRGAFRTQQDKLQLGSSYPISYSLKEEYESLSWAYIEKACAIFFDNKYLLAVPVDASTFNNEVWVYNVASQGWVIYTGWNVASWATMDVNGKQLLYYIDSNDGKVYQALTGFDDNDVAINYTEESRKEDMGQPLVKKTGGTLKVKALSAGDYDIDVYASIDDQEYTSLGVLSLVGDAPVLPVSLPFNLGNAAQVEGSFSLDGLGEWYQIRVKLEQNTTTGSDDVIIYEWNITTYANAYQSITD